MNKKIYKSREDRAISGVCAGLAEYFDIDVVIVRLLMVIFCFISFGVALVAYIVAAVIIPEEPTVRMNDGTRRPVYEATYEEKTENGQTRAAAGAEFNTGEGESAGGAAGIGQNAQQQVLSAHIIAPHLRRSFLRGHQNALRAFGKSRKHRHIWPPHSASFART